MSYTGIIHRQDTDTGVTLRAKAVTPNKMKAAVKNYKITVRKNPESSYQKALDLQAIVKNGIASLIGDESSRDDYSDIDFSALINEDTVITIINEYPLDPNAGTLLSQCYNEKGVLIATPKINEPNARGYLKFTTTTTGDDGKVASVSFSQYVVVKAKSSLDLLNKYTAKFAWNKIYRNSGSAGNSIDWKSTVDNNTPIFLNHNIMVPGNSASSGNGYLGDISNKQKVISPTAEEAETDALLFPELGAGKVFIRTEIIDDLKNGTSTTLFASDRLTNGGSLATSPSYTTVYNYLNSDDPAPNADMAAFIQSSVSDMDNQVRAHYIMGGLKIKSTLYMGKSEDNGATWEPDDTQKVEVFIPLETTSGYLTNQQVFEAICNDDNFVLQARSTSYDGTSIKNIATAGVFTGQNASRTALDCEGADVYVRFPNSQAAGVVGTDGMVFGNVPVKFQINNFAVRELSSGQLNELQSSAIEDLFGSNVNGEDCFNVLSTAAVEGSADGSWRGAVFAGSTGEMADAQITFVVSINVSSYAVNATASTFDNSGATAQTRYINLTYSAGTAE